MQVSLCSQRNGRWYFSEEKNPSWLWCCDIFLLGTSMDRAKELCALLVFLTLLPVPFHSKSHQEFGTFKIQPFEIWVSLKVNFKIKATSLEKFTLGQVSGRIKLCCQSVMRCTVVLGNTFFGSTENADTEITVDCFSLWNKV